MTKKQAWTSVVRTAAALAAAMGIGRFVYTPILPLMTAHANLTGQGAGQLATANYLGYLLGALAGTVWPKLTRSATAYRTSLVALIMTLVAMAVASNTIEWAALRVVAGFSSALVFVIAIDTLLEQLQDQPAHLTGWAFGGVGVGIAASATLVLVLPATSGWQAAWCTAAALAASLSIIAWPIRPAPQAISTPNTTEERHHHARRPVVWLLTSYTAEGVGYIIAGTFLVAAVAQRSPGWLGSGSWLMVGLAVIPSSALWSRLSSRFSHPRLLTAALFLQVIGIALAGTRFSAAAVAGAVLFGGTFIGVSTLALAVGRLLQFPRAVALLTAGYSAGQVAGPLIVSPLLHNGFHEAMLIAAALVLLAALAATPIRVAAR